MTYLDKKTVLLGYVLSVLRSVDSRYRADGRVRAEVLRSASASAMRRIMGRPVRYALVLPTGAEPADDDPATLDTFEVHLWHEYEDAEAAADSSSASFDEALRGESGLYALLSARPVCIESGGASAIVSRVSGLEVRLEALDGAGEVYAHYATFEAALYG